MHNHHRKMIRTGAYSLLFMSLLWVGTTVFLNLSYDYPWLLTAEKPDEALGRMLLKGPELRLWLKFYSFVPLLLIPGSVGLFYAFRDTAEGAMRVASQFLFVGMFTMILRLFVWPALNWKFAILYFHVAPEHRVPILATLYSLNYYLREAIGEYLSMTCFSVWALIISYVLYRDRSMPKWYAYTGFVVGVISFLEIFFRIGSLEMLPEQLIELIPLMASWIFVLSVGVLVYKGK